jgi:mycofactocin precursor
MTVATRNDPSSEPNQPPTGSDPWPATPGVAEGELVAEDLLVEDVSIDGMCGVY